MKRIILFCVSLFIFFNSIFAQTTEKRIEDAEKYFYNGEYEDGIYELEKIQDLITKDTNYQEYFTELANMYLMKKDWRKFVALHKGVNFTKDEDTSVLNAARFYTKFPKEKIQFGPYGSPYTTFKPSISGTPIVEVVVNGKKYKFWVDTGAGFTVISSKIAKKINLKMNGNVGATATAATGNNVSITYAIIDSLSFANINVKNHPCIVLNKKDLEFRISGMKVVKIDGIIGWNLLQEMAVTMNFKTNSICFQDSQIANTQLDKNCEVNFIWMGEPLVKGHLKNNSQVLFLFDSGASNSCVYEKIYGQTDTTGLPKKTFTMGSAGGTKKMTSPYFAEIKVFSCFGNVTLKDMVTHPQTGEKGTFAPHGCFGMKEIKDRVIFFNLKKGQFLLLQSQGE